MIKVYLNVFALRIKPQNIGYDVLIFRGYTVGRLAKPVSDYLRAAVVAAYLADQVGIGRTGYALAEWYEVRHNLPKGSVDEKTWRRFLWGHQPQSERMSTVIEMAPSVGVLYRHPFWEAIRPTCTESNALIILKAYGYDSHNTSKAWFKCVDRLPVLDGLAVLAVMLSLESFSCLKGVIGLRLCAAYAQLTLEEFWVPFSSDLLKVILLRFTTTLGCVAGFTEDEIVRAQHFWAKVRKDFLDHESANNEMAWVGWRQAVFALNWQDQLLLRNYIDDRSRDLFSQEQEKARRVYKRVRQKMYRFLVWHRENG